jgi:phosphoribosylformylglycinamidine cyclo-ligase
MLPEGARLRLRIRSGSWPVPPIFELLARGGDIDPGEMLRTFNMGVGMLVCVPGDRAAEAAALLERAGEQVFPVGDVVAADGPDTPVEFVAGDGA